MNIFRLILALFGLVEASFNQVQIAYDRIIRFLLTMVFPALLVSYLLNIGVSRWNWWPWLAYVPYLMGLLFSLVFIIIAFLPEVLAAIGITNLAQARLAPTDDPERKIWERYKKLVLLTIAWINIPFMYIGGIPGGANPFAVFAILSTVTIISIAGKKPMWRRIVMASAAIILAINLYSLAQPTIQQLLEKAKKLPNPLPSLSSSAGASQNPMANQNFVSYSPAPAPAPAVQVAAEAPSSANIVGTWDICWENNVEINCYPAIIKEADERIEIERPDPRGIAIFSGIKVGEGIYRGKWHEDALNAWGNFYLHFTGSRVSGTIDNGLGASTTLKGSKISKV